MSARSSTLHRKTSGDSGSATGSPASAGGPSPCASPACRTMLKCGREAPLASLSPRQARALGLLTLGTSGPISTGTLRSDVLAGSLVSRLKKRLGSDGSTLFALTWKLKITPSGQWVCLLRASARRTDASACSSWPTARAADGEKNVRSLEGSLKEIERKGGPQDLNQAACLASWATPSARDWHSASGSPEFLAGRAEQTRGKPLSEQAFTLAIWPTPMAGTPAQNGNNAAGNNDSSRKTVALCSWPTTTGQDSAASRAYGYGGQTFMTLTDAAPSTGSGPMLTGFPVETTSGGQLNPGFSLWLMGYGTEWLRCADLAMQSFPRSLRRSSKNSS